MQTARLYGTETADELTWLGFAFAHVSAYEAALRERRRARLAAQMMREGRRVAL